MRASIGLKGIAGFSYDWMRFRATKSNDFLQKINMKGGMKELRL
jgi:hypothetical protein